jgi:hypothetical protein
MFETETCGRCCGSGKYSFNLMHGDRCYGCGGTGLRFTKRGLAAKNFFAQSMKRAAGDIKVGEYIKTWVVLGGRDVWCVVESITECPLNKGMLQIDIKSTKSGKGMHWGVWACSEIVSVRSQAELDEKKAAALAYQATLGKSGKPLKRLAAAA